MREHELSHANYRRQSGGFVSRVTVGSSSQGFDRFEQWLGKHQWWPGAAVGGITLIALSPALLPLLRYRIEIPLPALAALGAVVGAHEFGGWCWRRR